MTQQAKAFDHFSAPPIARHYVALVVLAMMTIPLCHASPASQRGQEAAVTPSVIVGLNADPATDVAAMDKYEAAVRELLNGSSFAELDKIAASLRTNKTRFAGGPWKLYIFYRGLKQPGGGNHAEDGEWESHLEHLRAWTEQNPKSVTAWIALAEANFEYAEKTLAASDDAARDPGAKQVEGDTWELRLSRLHLAKLALQQASQLDTKCPHFYFVKQKIVRDPNKVLLQEALAFEPAYYYYYRIHALMLHLDWEAEPDAAEKFADDISSHVGGAQGTIIYYEIASALNGNAGSRRWPKTNFSWEKVQQGYAALEKQYGPSLFKMNQMAFLATRFEDAATAKRFFSRIGNQWDLETWGTQKDFESSQTWAMAPAEIEEARQAAALNEKTAEGKQYFTVLYTDIRRNYSAFFARCMQPLGDEIGGNFDLLFKVGGDGAIEEVRPWPSTKLSRCVVPFMRNGKMTAPPKPSFWVKVPIHLQ